MKHIHLNELDREGDPVFPAVQRQTLWFAFDYWVLEPGEVRSVEDGIGISCEQGYVFLGGPVELTARQQRIESGEGVGFIIEPTAEPTMCNHVLKNLSNLRVHVLRIRVALFDYRQPLQTLHIRVVPDSASDRWGVKIVPAPDVPPKAGTFDAHKLKWRDAIHGGCGQIATRHVLAPNDFYSDWTFLDHAILGAGGSVGYHYHDFLEESFVVLRGRGLMTIDDETFAVVPGSVTWQGIRQGHGIYNPGPERLEFVRIAVKQADEEYTTIDLHDDLSARRPR